ncbi:Pyridoxal kinase [Capsicum annuum]|uniref:pyridoxal kinase n=1 Tax=Capsicum annuum TaxID=4072 RepID=A0A2G3AAM2_CAPAN|nr:Pyridoxal kinase [Capsicum annuum]
MFASPLIGRIGSNSIRSLLNFRCSKQLHMAQPPILAVALPSDTGRVLSIQSHTIQGYVGNKSAVFPLQLLGYDVDPINSLENSAGYPTFKGQVLNGEQLWELIEGLEANDLLYYTHLLTGYIGSVSFLNTVLKVVDKLRSVNPKLTYVCDPVMGDEGKLYVPPELVAVYREKVVPVASMLTPNQFEAEQLTGSSITSEKDGQEACNILHAAGPSKVVITSINIDGTLLLIGSHQKEKDQSPEQFKIVIPKIPAYFTGTGDLMTALLLGWSNKYPNELDKAAELAVSSVQALLLRTLADYQKTGYDCQSSSLEIRLIQSLDEIRNPEWSRIYPVQATLERNLMLEKNLPGANSKASRCSSLKHGDLVDVYVVHQISEPIVVNDDVAATPSLLLASNGEGQINDFSTYHLQTSDSELHSDIIDSNDDSLYDVDKNVEDLSDFDEELLQAKKSNIEKQAKKRLTRQTGRDDSYFDSSDLGSDISDEEEGDPVDDDEVVDPLPRTSSSKIYFDKTAKKVCFQLYIVFLNAAEFREALQSYSIKKIVNLKLKPNEKERVRAKYQHEGCP